MSEERIKELEERIEKLEEENKKLKLKLTEPCWYCAKEPEWHLFCSMCGRRLKC